MSPFTHGVRLTKAHFSGATARRSGSRGRKSCGASGACGDGTSGHRGKPARWATAPGAGRAPGPSRTGDAKGSLLWFWTRGRRTQRAKADFFCSCPRYHPEPCRRRPAPARSPGPRPASPSPAALSRPRTAPEEARLALTAPTPSVRPVALTCGRAEAGFPDENNLVAARPSPDPGSGAPRRPYPAMRQATGPVSPRPRPDLPPDSRRAAARCRDNSCEQNAETAEGERRGHRDSPKCPGRPEIAEDDRECSCCAEGCIARGRPGQRLAGPRDSFFAPQPRTRINVSLERG